MVCASEQLRVADSWLWVHNEPCDGNLVRAKLGPKGCLPGASQPQQPLHPAGLSDHSSWSQGYFHFAISSSPLILPPCPSPAEMSTQGSNYINKEIKNALKGVKQIKNLIEQTNEERKSLLGTLEEAKKKKEVRVR